MTFWWVNHKKTFSSEVEGGYIWSPKQDSNGAKNQTYINLTLTCPGDIVISYAAGAVKAIGVVESRFQEQAKPSDFGSAGSTWSNIGWAVPISWQVLSFPLKPKLHIDRIAPLLPVKNSPLRANGNGNQKCYLASINNELGQLLLDLIKIDDPEATLRIDDEKNNIEEVELETEINLSNIESTEKEQIIKARKGQGIFRKNVERFERKCRVTGVDDKRFLIASHIKPWRLASNTERLDGNNGLMLSPHIDKLFDQGWISFEADGELILANTKIADVLSLWGVAIPTNVGRFNDAQIDYLKFHREKIYKG